MTTLLATARHHRDVPDAIVAGVEAAQWPGIVLPRKRIGGSLLYPVVTINEQAWRDRIAENCGPEYVLSTLYLWESWASDLGPMPPTRLCPSSVSCQIGVPRMLARR